MDNFQSKPIKSIEIDQGNVERDGQHNILTEDGRNAAAVLLGRRGGLKGGKARAEALTADRRREIAIKAAQSRWRRAGDEDGKA